MALQKEYQSVFGINFPEAYHRISAININRGVHGDDNVAVIIDVWITQKAREELLSPIYRKNIVLPSLDDKISANIIVAEIYNQIKVLEEFVGSVDV